MTKKVASSAPDNPDDNQVRDGVEPVSDTPELDEQAESLCRWGAARASAIVVLPLVGILWLTGNILYMVMRIAKLYGVTLSKATIKGFITAMAGNVLLLFCASSIPGLNVVIATGLTYGVGKAAQAWIKDGMPADVGKYKEEYEAAKKAAAGLQQEFKSDPRREKPLK